MTVGGYHNNFGICTFGEGNNTGLQLIREDMRYFHCGYFLVEDDCLRAVAEEIDTIAFNQHTLKMRKRTDECMILLIGEGFLKKCEKA